MTEAETPFAGINDVVGESYLQGFKYPAEQTRRQNIFRAGTGVAVHMAMIEQQGRGVANQRLPDDGSHRQGDAIALTINGHDVYRMTVIIHEDDQSLLGSLRI